MLQDLRSHVVIIRVSVGDRCHHYIIQIYILYYYHHYQCLRFGSLGTDWDKVLHAVLLGRTLGDITKKIIIIIKEIDWTREEGNLQCSYSLSRCLRSFVVERWPSSKPCKELEPFYLHMNLSLAKRQPLDWEVALGKAVF